MLGPWSDAAAMTCRELFTKDSFAIDAPEYRENVRLLQEKWQEAEIALAFGDRPLRPIERDLIDSAARLFEGSGVRFRRTTHEGDAAIEILANAPSAGRWNKMAHSIERNYSTRLIFSPLALMRISANAAFVPSSGKAPNVILISKGSIALGARDQAFTHELRHMAMNARQLESPTIFDGSIHARDPESQRIQSQATHYPTSMQLQELATHAQDLANVARRSNEPETATRSALESKAKVILEIVENSRVARDGLESFMQGLSSRIASSGPALAKSENSAPSLYVTKKDKTSIILEKAGVGSWFIQLQTPDHIVEVILKPSSRANRTRLNSNWDSLIEKTSIGDLAARKELLESLQNELKVWGEGLHRATSALEGPAQTLVRDSQSLPLDQLRSLAVRPRHDLGPLLRRAP